MNFCGEALQDSLLTPQCTYLDYVLTKYRLHIKELAEQASSLPIEIEDVGFLADYSQGQPESLMLKYLLLPDQRARAQSVGVLRTLETATWGLPRRRHLSRAGRLLRGDLYAKEHTGWCAPLLYASKDGLGVLSVANWRKKLDRRNYDKSIRAAEQKYFGRSRFMILLARRALVAFVHFAEELDEGAVGRVCSALRKAAFEELVDLFDNNWNLPRSLSRQATRFEKLSSGTSHYDWMVEAMLDHGGGDGARLAERADGLKKAVYAFEWREETTISELTSHGPDHAESVADLLGSFVYDDWGKRTKLAIAPLELTGLATACWMHDLGLTVEAKEATGLKFESDYAWKKKHGFISMMYIKSLLDVDEAGRLASLGFDHTTENDRGIVQVAAILSGYHQKKAMVEGGLAVPAGTMPSDPYTQAIPSEWPVGRSTVQRMQLYAALLRHLDACDIQCSRVSRLSTMVDRIIGRCENTLRMGPRPQCVDPDVCHARMKSTVGRIEAMLKRIKSASADYIALEAEYNSLVNDVSSCTNNAVKVPLLDLMTSPFHYGKNDAFLAAFFDRNQDLVLLSRWQASLDEIDYFWHRCTVSSVERDIQDEKSSIASILQAYDVPIGGVRVFDPCLDRLLDDHVPEAAMG